MNNMPLEWIYSENAAANCFFRTALKPPNLKVMLQITTRCNMRCKHCFLSATEAGIDMPFSFVKTELIKKLIESKVKKVTLTGGEPLLHPNLVAMIEMLNEAGIQSCICTNASLITERMLERIKNLNVHFNVSLDGINAGSHGLFRGISSIDGLSEVFENIQMIGRYNLLNGILTTPNKFAKVDEYVEICDFAIQSGAAYLLMNPLSPFGRGKDAIDLSLSCSEMNEIKAQLDAHISKLQKKNSFRIVYIRFPNYPEKDPSPCAAGLIPYIFTNGDIAICPYMVFAADRQDSNYSRDDFIVGNVHENGSIADKIENYRKTHFFCQEGRKENQGCAAMKIARNLSMVDNDML